MKKIILFELNEVPTKVINFYCKLRPNSTLNKVLKRARTFETMSNNETHLSPWRTWPSLHRGVNEIKHDIFEFGQDHTEVDKAYPNVWDILRKNKVDIGVCGSLHSYQSFPKELDHIKFYLPDTFAAGSECFPKKLESFQEFNLKMVAQSSRNVSRGIDMNSAIKLMINGPQIGLGLNSIFNVGSQLASELSASWKKARRRTTQVQLVFDIFYKQLLKEKPAFTTFFTNHVASSMHRYWAAVFPEDYDTYEYDDEWKHQYENEIIFTMDVFDKMLAKISSFVDKNSDFQLWVTSSMGQEATEAGYRLTSVCVQDLSKFFEFFGLRSEDYTKQLAMFPQYNLSIAEDKIEALYDKLKAVRIDDQDLRLVKKGQFLSFSLGHDNCHDLEKPVAIGESRFSLAELGLGTQVPDELSGCNAYHIPNGSLFIYDAKMPEKNGKEEEWTQIADLDLAPTILNNYGVAIPEYMNKPVELFN